MNIIKLTPAQIEGPFYPVCYQLKESNDLTRGKTGVAQGEIITIVGQVTDTQGYALPNILIELWQTDTLGQYRHPKDQHEKLDPNFAYWGLTVTDVEGRYYFRTIKPAAYNDDGDWRTPHVHFKLFRQRHVCELTTQLYFEGEIRNQSDNHLSVLDATAQQQLLTTPKRQIIEWVDEAPENYAVFDIVLKRL